MSCVSYGLLFFMGRLSGNIYMNMLFYGLFRVLISFGTGSAEIFLKKCGRKTFHIVGGGFIAVATTVTFILYATGIL